MLIIAKEINTHMPEALRVGRISYLNILPIFAALREISTSAVYTLVESYPSALNRMLREGELDISPSSSIEYLRDRDSYRYIEGHSISSRGAIRSILLFSRLPVEDLSGAEIMSTHQSETSIALLRIILRRFYGHDCSLRVTEMPLADAIRRHSAYLSIGDEALMAFGRARVLDMRPPPNCQAVCSIDHQVFYVYDIGSLWHFHTGLPAVFALWTYRADLSGEKQALIESFGRDLSLARDHAVSHLDAIADESEISIPADEAAEYWRGIIYDLPEDCREGLELFGRYLAEDP